MDQTAYIRGTSDCRKNIRALKRCLKHIEPCFVPTCKVHSATDLDLHGFSPHSKNHVANRPKKMLSVKQISTENSFCQLQEVHRSFSPHQIAFCHCSDDDAKGIIQFIGEQFDNQIANALGLL
ncbi:hypothetical protein CDAR_44451 [Caerostris darwini]|uniref:Uncharacterized protein n=1 Tax=Caerostris darwini TaxID=1538125 RepID=A0AAV4QRX5_9ARAC|nr:hypothetical protein CDAR_44451 [Caerostris darwini]